ncbi:MAG: hypothetical protein K8T25_07585 [Planctomycetia bacterium]|nr:hypothetical protein [Planctomycetia bacterium]
MTEIMVHAGPYATRTECERYLVHELATAVEQYIQTEIAHVAGYHVSVPQDLIERLSNDRFLSTEHKALSKLADDQEMFESFALLKFDQEAKDRLRILWQQAVARQRVRTAGTWLAIALVVLSAGWFVLRRGAGKSAPAPAANRSANVHA